MKLWNGSNFRQLVDSPYASDLACSKKSRLIACAFHDHWICLIDAVRGEIVRKADLGFACKNISFSPDGHYLATESEAAVHLWRTSDLQAVPLPITGSWSETGTARFNPKQNLLATLDEDGLSVRIWEVDPDRLFAAKRTVRRRAGDIQPESVPSTAVDRAAPTKVAPVSTRMMSDAPVTRAEDDLLEYDVYAEALAGLIDNPVTATPLTIAINAQWGAGKSTLAELIKRRLEDKPAAGGSEPHVICDFNAWLHDDAGNLGTALVATVARKANEGRRWLRRLFSPLPSEFASRSRRGQGRRWWFTVAVVVGLGIGFWGLIKVLPPGSTEGLFKAFGLEIDFTNPSTQPSQPAQTGGMTAMLVGMVALVPLIRWLFQTASAVAGFVSRPENDANTGTISEVRRQLHRLIDQGTPKGSRFVIFIDDVERCRPPKAMEVMETVNQLLNRERVVTVVLADMPMLAAAADCKYEQLALKLESYRHGADAGGQSNRNFGRLYLQKFVQFQFDLPALSDDRLQRLAKELTEEDEERA
ncbi:MAG: hypothetical protein IH986_07470 [Planctomycetes bacterium]|nr:hypothetical protein [Planctomycetota bacterium]